MSEQYTRTECAKQYNKMHAAFALRARLASKKASLNRMTFIADDAALWLGYQGIQKPKAMLKQWQLFGWVSK